MRQLSSADRRGAAGNVYAKYDTGNPVSRAVVGRFLRRLELLLLGIDPSQVLDAGCGEGVVTERMARLLPSARVVGMDVQDSGLASQWTHRRAPNLSFRIGSAYALPYRDDAFDLVCAIEVLEHLERPEIALTELVRVARRAVVVSVPCEPLWRLGNLLSGRYLLALGNTPGHVNHWSRHGIARLVARHARVQELCSVLPWTIVHAAPGGRACDAEPQRGGAAEASSYGTG